MRKDNSIDTVDIKNNLIKLLNTDNYILRFIPKSKHDKTHFCDICLDNIDGVLCDIEDTTLNKEKYHLDFTCYDKISSTRVKLA